MGWKNVKEHYRIVHTVQVTEDGICIGSPYVHNIIVVSMAGDIVKSDDRTLNRDLQRYQGEMSADPEHLRLVVQSEDTFKASIPVFTYSGAEIIEKRCEELGWPNVTHNGAMMYENTFFAEREKAIEAARRNCEAAIMLRQLEISDKQERLNNSIARLKVLQDNALKLGIVISPETPAPAPSLPYQKRVRNWMDACFGNEISYDVVERNFRFLEEALELAQSCGATADEARTLIDYVFSRPVGDPRQEVGGVEVTLAALCNARGINLDEAREAELTRVWSKVEQIRAKHESKPKGIRSPLPGGADHG